MSIEPLFLDENSENPAFFKQDYYACDKTKNCVLRYRSEILGREPERSMTLETGTKEGWNGIFALPAARSGVLDDDIVRAADWLKANGQKDDARSFLARTTHFRSGGNPTGKSLYGMFKTLEEVEEQMIAGYNSRLVQDKPTFSQGETETAGARATYTAGQEGKVVETHYDNGTLKSRQHFLDGRPHRLDGPAFEMFYDDGQPWASAHYKNGVYHNNTGPAVQLWNKGPFPYVLPYLEEWWVDGKMHRDDGVGPAHRRWDSFGCLQAIEHHVNGKKRDLSQGLMDQWSKDLHESDSSQMLARNHALNAGEDISVERYANGVLVKLIIRNKENGKLHRDDGPAKLEWSRNGKLVKEGWFRNGKFHREDGPAFLLWDKSCGSLLEEGWRRDGKVYSPTAHALMTWKMKNAEAKTAKTAPVQQKPTFDEGTAVKAGARAAYAATQAKEALLKSKRKGRLEEAQ